MVTILLALALAQPQPETVVEVEYLSASGAEDPVPVALRGSRDLDDLCAALEPGERLRPRGDAVTRSEAEDAHEERRELVTVARYVTTTTAPRLGFAPYDRGGSRLTLSGTLVPLRGGGRLFLAMEAGLPVEADAERARRIVEAQRKGELELELVFDLADDTTCSRGRPRTLPVEPVTWTWRAGGAPLARGGAGAERPIFTARTGARPKVGVGEPLQGPAGSSDELRRRQPALLVCYGKALERVPDLDGVLVLELAPGRPVPYLSGDSVGDPGLADCVKQAVAGVTVPEGIGAVPVRFELEVPSASR